jgi:hypothetical protein
MRWAKWASVRKSDHRRSPKHHPLMDTTLKESGTSGLHSVISTAKKATLYRQPTSRVIDPGEQLGDQ